MPINENVNYKLSAFLMHYTLFVTRYVLEKAFENMRTVRIASDQHAHVCMSDLRDKGQSNPVCLE